VFGRMVGGIVDCGICCFRFSEDVDFYLGGGVELLVERENLCYCCVQK